MPRQRFYGSSGGQPQARDMGEWFNLGRMIRDQVSGAEKHQQAMDREFEGLELEEAQAKVMELKGKQKRQMLVDQIEAAKMGRQGDIDAAKSLEGVSDMSVPPQDVRGIQIPQAGIDVPGYQIQPQTQEMNLQRMIQEQAVENTVPVPPELQNLSAVIPGFPQLPTEMNKDVLDLVLRLVSQLSMTERQGTKIEATGEQKGFDRGSREKVAGMGVQGRAAVAGEKIEATATENEKKRRSIEEQKRKDRASREKIAKMKSESSPDSGFLKDANDFRASMGLAPLPSPSEGKTSKSAPVDVSKLAAAHAKPVRTKGNGQEITEELAKKYLAAAKGDWRLAEQWAKEDNWKF